MLESTAAVVHFTLNSERVVQEWALKPKNELAFFALLVPSSRGQWVVLNGLLVA